MRSSSVFIFLLIAFFLYFLFPISQNYNKLIIHPGPTDAEGRYKQTEESQERQPQTHNQCLPNRPTLLGTKCSWAASATGELCLQKASHELSCRIHWDTEQNIKETDLKITHASNMWLCTMFSQPIKLSLFFTYRWNIFHS